MTENMGIVIERIEVPTVVLRAEVLSDDKLSWAARGIHAYLFATWSGGLDVQDTLLKVTAKGILGDKNLPDRIKRLKSYCLELEQRGYAKRDDKGTLILLDRMASKSD